MSRDKKTEPLNKETNEEQTNPVSFAAEIPLLYGIIRSKSESRVRRNSAVKLLDLAEDGRDLDEGILDELFSSEKDLGVATELKRVLNKVRIRQILIEDPTSKYDRKLTSREEAEVLEEIDRIRTLYDKSSKEKGGFDKRYRIIKKIADGGMGRIYKAIRREDKRHVAIKFLLVEELSKRNDRTKIIARFKREASILTRLDHPNIVKAFEYGEAEGEYFMVMEYMGGGSLDDSNKNKALDLQTARTIGFQLCDAVEYIHRNGIIHRDIKPGNILIHDPRSGLPDKAKATHDAGYPMRVKLADFGLAKDRKDQSLSKISFQAGTEDFSSPQQLKDARDADERDDIYSIGKTLYTLLTGTTLRNDEDYVSMRSLNQAVPEDLDSLIERSVQARREDRFGSVSAMKEAIKEIIG